MSRPKKRYAYGFDWCNWNVGFKVIKINGFGVVISITILPLTLYLKFRRGE